MKIANLKIGTRLGLGFGLILLMLSCVAAVGISVMSRTNSAMHHITDVNVAKMQLLEDMSSSVHIVARVMRTMALVEDKAIFDEQKKKITAAREKYDASFKSLQNMPLDEAGKTFVSQLAAEHDTVRPVNNHFIELSATDKQAALKVLLNEVMPLNQKWLDSLQEFVDLQRSKNRKEEELASSSYESGLIAMLVLALSAICIGVFVAWYSTRSITRPLIAAVAIAKTVAAGDLTSDIQITSTDETGQLLLALKEMNSSLLNIVAQVRMGTDEMATASGQIAAGNLDLSSRTEEQASSLEETASSMEELTSTVKHNADNASQASQLASNASETAVRGGAVVSQVVDTMGSIHESSKKIVDIISVIDGIAFQTNILALNAAVEAARAGEQGRGFAVVATEVRNLAQRSATAAKEIKLLINDSVEKVATGSKLVQQAGTTMDDVVHSVKQVNDIITEITAAGREQASGIDQINSAVAQMDQVTQQNASLVEEAAAAAESLQDQAATLARLVSVFKVDTNEVRQQTATAAPVRLVTVKSSPGKSSGFARRPALTMIKASPAKAVSNGADNGSWEEF
ncbi:methyl-accepting chemotaxis protein [Undibacterium terreum]|uniref:Methyl-accepting chemotaxis protein n=1 Tax=Undibacterium terreum TaxID=1224302 RepID=A0A916U9G6_9BURK|nr:methyl-accepting chemotaxis protein [Undibacterium terreum]GGC65518.1 methyl-accepting chemotaxis protein [Undibacterium terreum]